MTNITINTSPSENGECGSSSDDVIAVDSIYSLDSYANDDISQPLVSVCYF